MNHNTTAPLQLLTVARLYPDELVDPVAAGIKQYGLDCHAGPSAKSDLGLALLKLNLNELTG